MPDIVILPLGLEESAGKHRLSLLISNFSSQAVNLDLASLRWLNREDKHILPSLIRIIWQLGELPEPAPYTTVQLGAARPTGLGHSELDSPMVWTGALRGLLAGPADSSMPNCIVAELEFAEDGTRWLELDADDLARSAASGSGMSAMKVVVHQLNQTYLSMELPDLPLSGGYHDLPASAAASASDFLEPHRGDCAADGNDINFWHIENPPESTEHWVTFDFGKPVTITGLAILPRQGQPDQLWGKDHAILQGSNASGGKTGWAGIARLYVDKTALGTETWHWLQYEIPNVTTFRYYRILIDDPSFLSIAEIKFRAVEWGILISVDELVQQGVLELVPFKGAASGKIRLKNKEVTISGVLTIPRGYVLELEPGDNLRFTRNAGILSYSPIRAIGSAESPVILAPVEEGVTWAGVAVVDAQGTSEFCHVKMSQAAGGLMGDVQFSGGLSFMDTSVVLTDTTLQDFSSEDGLHLSDTTYEISRLIVNNSRSDGIDSDWSYGDITDIDINGTGGDGMDFSGSLVTVRNARIAGAGDKGVSVGEGSVVRLEDVSATSCRTGIAIKDASFVTIAGGELARNQYGLLRYIKKPVYTYPGLTISGMTFSANRIDRRDEPSNQWIRYYDN